MSILNILDKNYFRQYAIAVYSIKLHFVVAKKQCTERKTRSRFTAHKPREHRKLKVTIIYQSYPQVDGGGGEVQGPEEHLDLVRSEAAAGDLHDVLGSHRQRGHSALDLQNMQGVFQPDRLLVELETKVKQRFAKLSQSRRRPLLGPY